MTIVPLNDRILVRPRARDEITAGGVVLPETVRHDDTDEGYVVDRGQSSLEDGDRIVHTKHAGSELKIDGETLLLIPEKNVLAVYRG
jgi:chaperonin GroES